MAVEFNFGGLHPLFVEAVKRHEPSVAFVLTDGPGKFVFLLFLATDSKGELVWGDMELFILLGRTQRILRFKLFGNHFRTGDFKIWLDTEKEQAIRKELGIVGLGHGTAFSLLDFLAKLNGMIPETLPLAAKIDAIQRHRRAIEIHCRDYLEEASKVYLLGTKALPEGNKPREETLRKLYMLEKNPADITALIGHLKTRRWTVCWTATKPSTDKFSEVFAKVVGAGRH